MTIVTPTVEDPGVAADQRFGQAVLRGTLIGYAVIFTLVTAGALVAGLGVSGSLGVGAFCAFMGSLGWGGMLGVTVIATREMNAAESTANRHARSQR
jgi:hypothetical protein